MKQTSFSYIIFNIMNLSFLLFLSILCILPFIHFLAVSLSGIGPSQANQVGLWPIELNFDVYRYVFEVTDFAPAFLISIKRVVLGICFNLILTLLLAYPLSKESSVFKSRNIYVWIVVFSMFFNGGLIPNYILIKELNLFDSIWALIFTNLGGGFGAAPVFLVVLLLNFFRQLPKELDECATIDGANEYIKLWKIFIPLSIPALVTITMFSMVYHWNAWFDGLIFNTQTENYPLQTFLRTEINRVHSVTQSMDDVDRTLRTVSQRSTIAAQICIAILPIMIVYPFLQKYFKDGIVLGSVKG